MKRLNTFVVLIAAVVSLSRCGGEDRATRGEPEQSAAAGESYEPPARAAHRTRLVLLGTGTPNPDPACSGPSVAVVVDEEAYIVDFGPGVVRRAAAANLGGIAALDPERLDIAFATHLHSDHTMGYPDLVFTPWVIGRRAPLNVYGPPGLERMTSRILEAWSEDIAVRSEGNQPDREGGWRAIAHEVEPGEIYRDDKVKVTAFEVKHGAWEHAYGYRFDGPDRSIVISGDTRPTESVVEACDGCDVLVHEVFSYRGFSRRPADWQRYHIDSHTSSLDLGEIAARARPGLLVLYHQLLWGDTPQMVLDDIGRSFQGRVAYGRDLDVY